MSIHFFRSVSRYSNTWAVGARGRAGLSTQRGAPLLCLPSASSRALSLRPGAPGTAWACYPPPRAPPPAGWGQAGGAVRRGKRETGGGRGAWLTAQPSAAGPTARVAPRPARHLGRSQPMGTGCVCARAGRAPTGWPTGAVCCFEPPRLRPPDACCTHTRLSRRPGDSPDDEHGLVEHLEEGDLAQGGGRDALLLHLRKPRTAGEHTTLSAPHRGAHPRGGTPRNSGSTPASLPACPASSHALPAGSS